MPPRENAILRVHTIGSIPVAEFREFLASFEHAYNSLLYFEYILDAAERVARQSHFPFFPYLWFAPLPFRRTSAPFAGWPPTAQQIASALLPRDRIVLIAAEMKSPGYWDFLGKLVPFEVGRQYLQDRHERRKDREYRETAEKRRLELENTLLENKIIAERIEIAKKLGATDEDLAPLLNDLVIKPVRELEKYQDRGVIETAEIVKGTSS
jgi:hypothetical protein